MPLKQTLSLNAPLCCVTSFERKIKQAFGLFFDSNFQINSFIITINANQGIFSNGKKLWFKSSYLIVWQKTVFKKNDTLSL